MITTHFKSLAPLALILVGLLGYNFMSAQWTPPTGIPPTGNVPAPVNVGYATQTKSGSLRIGGTLRVATSTATGISTAWNHMRSDLYCDAVGQNCFDPAADDPFIELKVINGETNGLTLTAQSLCTAAGHDGVWAAIDQFGAEDIICYNSPIVGNVPAVESFVSAYHALRTDPSFRNYWGSTLPQGAANCTTASLYRCGVGWMSFGSTANGTDRKKTYDRICGFMMTNGTWKSTGPMAIYDSGSDNGNLAMYWTGTATGQLGHGNDSVDDTTQITCQGDGVTTQGNWWLLRNRPESYGRAGNFYPVPPLRSGSVITYAWSPGAYGSCIGINQCTSGPGTATRPVVCRDSNGITVADSRCTGAKPATTQSCSYNAPTGWPCR